MRVFDLQLENTAKKRERTTSDPRTTEQKQEKKRLKIAKKQKDPDSPENEFTPYDYSKSDFTAFAGEARSGAPKGVSGHVRWKETKDRAPLSHRHSPAQDMRSPKTRVIQRISSD